MNLAFVVQARIYSCTLSLDAFRKRMSSLVKVENDKPMMKYLVAQFVGGKGGNCAKELYGYMDDRSFRVWDSDTFWTGLLLTYVQGVYKESGSGVQVILRPRRNLISRVSQALAVVVVVGSIASHFFETPPPTLLGAFIEVVVCLGVGVLASLPFILPHRFIGVALVEFLERELGLVEVPRT